MTVSNIQVKICGIRSESDAAFVQELGADYVGMIHFERSPRHVSFECIQKILPAIQCGHGVAVLVEPEIYLLESLMNVGIEVFQIHLNSNCWHKLRLWAEIIPPSRLWLAPKLPPGEEFPEEMIEYAETILIDTYSSTQSGGTGKTGDWEGFSSLVNRYPDTRFVLAGGLNPKNIRDALTLAKPKIVDVNSGVESQPGVKDRKKIKELFEQLRLGSLR